MLPDPAGFTFERQSIPIFITEWQLVSPETLSMEEQKR